MHDIYEFIKWKKRKHNNLLNWTRRSVKKNKTKKNICQNRTTIKQLFLFSIISFFAQTITGLNVTDRFSRSVFVEKKKCHRKVSLISLIVMWYCLVSWDFEVYLISQMMLLKFAFHTPGYICSKKHKRHFSCLVNVILMRRAVSPLLFPFPGAV